MTATDETKRDRARARPNAGCIADPCERIVLSETDWDAFHDALADPPEPNEALKGAARRYRERAGV